VLTELRREDGASAVELAWVVPILLLVLTVAVPSLEAGWRYMSMSRAASAGIRYATRVDTHPRQSSVGLTRRPTTTEVQDFVREAASPLELDSVTVDPEPAGALPGEAITVTVTHGVSYGPLASVANTVAAAFGGRGILPEETSVTVSARGRQE